MINPAATIMREFSGAWATAEHVDPRGVVDWTSIMLRYSLLSGAEKEIVSIARSIDESWGSFDAQHQALIIAALLESYNAAPLEVAADVH